MRILFLSPRQCWPPTSGARLREYHLARGLSRHADVSLLAFAAQPQGGPRDRTGEKEIEFFRRVLTVSSPPRYTPIKLIRGLAGKTPLLALNYTTRAMAKALASLLRECDFDLVQVESPQMASYAPILNHARLRPLVVYDWHNIASELVRRYSESTPSAVRRFYARHTATRLEWLELSLLREADAHLVCSAREREVLLERAPQARVLTAPNGVDVEYFSQEPRDGVAAGAARRLVFVGSMDYHANIEAVVAFARDIWPSVRQHLPGCQFTIVGSNPAPEVRELVDQDAITVTGTVPDVRRYYREALAAVVPVSTAGGTRIKILEAMAAGVPVVSTPLGAEGLDVTNGENILLAQAASDWTAGLRSLAENEDQRRRLIAAGRSLVKARYDWSSLSDALLDAYSDLLSHRRPA